MTKRGKKSFIWQRPMLLALLAVAGSFGIGLILLISRANHQVTLLPIPQFKQSKTPNPESSSTKAPSLQQSIAAKSLIINVPRQFEGTTVSEAKLSGSDKVIALTFDDGPWPKNTEQVLNILQQHKIKATFFWIGKNVQNYPQIAQEVVAAGHTIGNHTWHHWYRRMDETTAAFEIDRTAEVIYKTTGVKTDLFRPPGGFLKNGQADYAKKHKYLITMWSDDAQEFTRRTSSSKLVNNVLHNAKPGGIVLMHDGGGPHQETMEALPHIIDGLTKRGYRFVTVPELLEIQDKERAVTTATKPALTTPAAQRQLNHDNHM